MELSFWEIESWFTEIDYTVVGSGIVGLTCALHLRSKFPKAKILVLEKGALPQGASTKNAGFACFGSISEILDDLKTHSEEEIKNLVKQRYTGLTQLRFLLGDEAIDYQEQGGYELFVETDAKLYDTCLSKVKKINKLLFPVFNQDVYSIVNNSFGYKQIKSKLIFNKLEGQIDTGKMMNALIDLVYSKSIRILNNVVVKEYEEMTNGVNVVLPEITFRTKKLLIATNGFAGNLDIKYVKPARAQVLITEPIPDLKIKGTFHLDQGYYYFRNINNRILLGGGRHLDFKSEETTQIGQTELVQNELERLLKETILPNKAIKIEHRWSGIMGVGTQKKPIVKQLSNNVYCGVRLGGMGIAIGTTIGQQLADLIE